MPPCANSAQAMRAILLASATATTLKGRRAKSCVSQGYFSGSSLARRNTEWAPNALRRHNAELGQVPTQRIDQLGALAHQQIAGAVLHHSCCA